MLDTLYIYTQLAPFFLCSQLLIRHSLTGSNSAAQISYFIFLPLLVQRAHIAVCTIRGLAHLHSQQPALIHRDIKSDNCLLNGYHDELFDPRCVELSKCSN
jgi:serine/threonine protein kinase